MYKIIAYRRANSEAHSYLVGEKPTIKGAISLAEKETANRAGNYACAVIIQNCVAYISQIPHQYKTLDPTKEIKVGDYIKL